MTEECHSVISINILPWLVYLSCFKVSPKELAAGAWIVLGELAVATETKLTVEVCIILPGLVVATAVGAVVDCALEGGCLAGVGTG